MNAEKRTQESRIAELEAQIERLSRASAAAVKAAEALQDVTSHSVYAINAASQEDRQRHIELGMPGNMRATLALHHAKRLLAGEDPAPEPGDLDHRGEPVDSPHVPAE